MVILYALYQIKSPEKQNLWHIFDDVFLGMLAVAVVSSVEYHVEIYISRSEVFV